MISNNYYEAVDIFRVIIGTYGQEASIEDIIRMTKYVIEELGTPPDFTTTALEEVPF